MPGSRNLKPLAIGSCIGDLNKHTDIVKVIITNETQCRQYCTSFAQIFKKAEAKYQDGDEENAYILFMRLMYIFEKIRKSYEYQKKKKIYNDIMNINNVTNAMERAEMLSKSLEARYKKLEHDRSMSKSNKGKSSAPQDNKIESTSKDTSGRLPSSPLKPKASPNLGPAPRDGTTPKESKASVITSLPDVPKIDDEMDGVSSAKFPRKVDPWIDPDELYNLFKSGNLESILVMDARPPDEFAASRIKSSSLHQINIKEELLKPGANINSIERRLSNDVWSIWTTRGSKDHVILLDHNSTRENTGTDSPIQILKDALCNTAVPMKSEPRLLHSGFSGWQLYYPSLCTDPYYKKAKRNPTSVIPDPKKLLSNLSYPTLNGLNANKEKPSTTTARSVDLPPRDDTIKATSDAQASIGNGDDDTFARLRRQLDGPPDSKSKAESPGGIPSSKDDYAAREVKSDSRGPDTRLRTDSSGSNFGRKKNHEGMTNGDTDSAHRLDTPKANKVLPKDVPASGKESISNGSSSLPTEMTRKGDRANEERIGNGQRTNQFPPDAKANSKDIEIITAEYSREEPKNGFPGSASPSINGIISSHGNSQNFDPRYRPFSDMHVGVNNGPLHWDGRPMTHFMNEGGQRPAIGSSTTQSWKNGPESPVLGIPGAGHKPSPVNAQSRPAGPGSGHYGSLPRMQGHNQTPTGSMTNRTTTTAGYTPFSMPQSGPNSGKLHEGDFSSKTFPRAKSAQPSNQPAIGQSKPNSGVQHPPTPGTPGPVSSANSTTVTSSSVTFNQSKPPSSVEPQQFKQHPVVHSPGSTRPSSVAAEQGAPISTFRTQQPHSLPHEPSKRDTVSAIAKDQSKELKSSSSEIRTSPGLPHGWEKSIEGKTGRVYYIDHTTKSTHWELPPDFYADRERDAALKQKRKAPEPPVPLDTTSTTSSLRRSLSTPNLADMETEKTTTKPKMPVVDRSLKPSQPSTQLVDRSTKPLSKSRLEALCPIYGSKGCNLTGLKNLGNTCYMNAVVQCLSSTVPLSRYFNSGEYLRHLNSRSMNRRPEEVAKELGFLLKVLWSGQYRSVSPVDFKAAVGRFASQFAGYNQQDAHEFLMFFMDGIHEDTNKIQKRTPMIEQNNDNIPDSISSVYAWKDYAKNNDSIVVDLFQGQFRSTVCCKTCGKKSVTFDVFSCLPLELTSQRACTLDDCIRAFTKPEMIGGYDSWKCTKCKTYREATKTIELWKLPPVIVFQLKRFSSDGRWHNKIQAKVDFPVSDLNMSRYLVGSDSKFTTYNLYGIVNHYGSFESGHYTSYCLNQQSWYSYDDNVVSSISKGKLKSPAAYLLFYTAVDFKSYLK